MRQFQRVQPLTPRVSTYAGPTHGTREAEALTKKVKPREVEEWNYFTSLAKSSSVYPRNRFPMPVTFPEPSGELVPKAEARKVERSFPWHLWTWVLALTFWGTLLMAMGCTPAEPSTPRARSARPRGAFILTDQDGAQLRVEPCSSDEPEASSAGLTEANSTYLCLYLEVLEGRGQTRGFRHVEWALGSREALALSRALETMAPGSGNEAGDLQPKPTSF